MARLQAHAYVPITVLTRAERRIMSRWCPCPCRPRRHRICTDPCGAVCRRDPYDIKSLALARMSHDEVPIDSSKTPEMADHEWLCASHVEKSRAARGSATVAESAGASCTLRKPLSWRGGSPAVEGYVMYSCATVAPVTSPVLVRVKLTPFWVTCRAVKLHAE